MEVVRRYQLLPYPLRDSNVTHNTLWHHNRSAATFGTANRPPKLSHYELQKKKRGFGCLLIFRKV